MTPKIALVAALALLPLSGAMAQTPPGKHTTINPVDLDYRYNWEQQNQGISYRTGADPAIVRHKGVFYLFETLADGYWRSTDLIHWTFIKPNIWPFRGIVAPAVTSDGKRLYIKPSAMEPGAILVTDDPDSGNLQFLTRRTRPIPGAVMPGQEDTITADNGKLPPGPWDPDLFRDDDGRWYMYWGSSNVFPLYGSELDPKDRLNYVGKPKPLFKLDPASHGWERFGQDHCGCLPNGTHIDPYIEGAWMTKHDGRYYLQYGGPGTEYNAYANGTYVADKPLGPFHYAPWNPVAYKPGGFVEGAGHGSTFDDNYGNFYNSGTPWIGNNWTFERRIAIFPVHFYPDGQMSASTRFGDFPQWVPDHKIDDPNSLFTGWMLLSYKKKATASSQLDDFSPDRVTDENPRTFWVAARNEAGQTLTLDLGGEKTVRAVQVNFADYKSGRFGDAPDIYTEFKLEASSDGKNWSEIARTEPPRRDRPNAYFELAKPVKARFIRYVHGHVGAAHLAISDLRVFGNAGGKPPATPAGLTAIRSSDPRDAVVSFKPVRNVVGYNVRFGTKPDRLTQTYQLFGDSERGKSGKITLKSLNKGVDYWVAVEAFDENGVSKLSRVIQIKGSANGS